MRYETKEDSLPASEKVVAWSSRLLPSLIMAALLIPGNAWLVQDIRTFAALITVLILPGYALAACCALAIPFTFTTISHLMGECLGTTVRTIHVGATQ